jgi:hypothetical protein
MADKALDALTAISEAADDVARLEPQLKDARARLHGGILRAHRLGASIALIAKTAGLSRQRIHQIVEKDS